MTTRRAVSASFVLALALAACGGGGGLTTAARSSASSDSTAKATATTDSTTTLVVASDSSSSASDSLVAVEPDTSDTDDAGASDVTPVVVNAQPGPGDLVGSWLGPMPGDNGRCGSAVSEWTLAADGSYQVTNRSTECGGFTVFGTYSADGSTIAFEQRGSDCPTCIQAASYSVDYSFISDLNSLEIVDGPQSFVLHRQ